ncbi:MAG: hypothetical protein EBT33_21130, partial [Betaproteobacteria bacterium]|nr:hypothetical protein [Betaproteobacteria bacterium]
MLEINGGPGVDTLMIMGGGPGSVVRGGPGNDRILGGLVPGLKVYGDEGNDIFSGGEAGAIIDLGAGRNVIQSGTGDDEITIRGSELTTLSDAGGNNRIRVESTPEAHLIFSRGRNEISADWVGLLHVEGGVGEEVVIFDDLTSTQALELQASGLLYDGRTLTFNAELDRVEINDLSTAGTVLTSTEDASWGSTDLVLNAAGLLNLEEAVLTAPGGHFDLQARGIVGEVHTELAALTLVNLGQTDNIAVTVREVDDLILKAGTRGTAGGLITDGPILIESLAAEGLLTLESGALRSATGGITLIADDLDFASGDDRVSAPGELKITTKTPTQGYRIGSAGQSVYANDRSINGATGFLELGMRDVSALRDGFSAVRIGHAASLGAPVMYVGDLENKTVFANVFSARLDDPTFLEADTINIVGDVQASGALALRARLIEVWSGNIHDGLGSPDSGVTADEIRFVIDEQWVHSGWLRATRLIDVAVTASTGNGALVRYGPEPNSITADVGSVIQTTGDESLVKLASTTGSIIVATAVAVGGADSAMEINAGSGLRLLEGASLAVEGDRAAMTLRSRGYLSLDSGAAIRAGAAFRDEGGMPVAYRTGVDTVLLIDTDGELGLAGSLTTGGTMTLRYGETTSSHASYFDTINGRRVAEIADQQSVAAIVTALRAGNISAELRQSLAGAGLGLAESAVVTAVGQSTPFAALSNESKLAITTSLGYTRHAKGGYYNESTGAFYESIEIGPIAPAVNDAQALARGYEKLEGVWYYQPASGMLKRSLIEGESADYSNASIDWASFGVEAPVDAATPFESLSAEQQAAVAHTLGYTPEPVISYERETLLGKPDDRRSVFQTYYYDPNAAWGDQDPGSARKLSELSIDQKVIAAKYLSAFPDFDLREVVWPETVDPAVVGTEFDRLTPAQRT